VSLVILDRDGVINHDSPDYIKSPDEWIPIEGSLEAIARLHHAGARVVIATNQSAVGRRLMDMDALNRIHERMHRQLAEVGGVVEAIFFCPHSPSAKCHCRKPNTGMLEAIAERLRVDLAGVPMVGDSDRDLVVARRAGARPMLVRTGKGAETLASAPTPSSLEVFDDLSAAADSIIAEMRQR